MDHSRRRNLLDRVGEGSGDMCLTGSLRGLIHSFLAHEFVHVTELAPFAHDNVATFVDGSAVWGVADAVLPLIGRQFKIGTLLLIGIISELRYDLALFI